MTGMSGIASTARRGVIDRYRSWLPVTESTPVITLGEGSTPLVPRERAVGRAGLRGLAEGRGRQPHRVVQGPRHDRRGQRLRGRGRPGGGLRLHRQHLGLGGRVRLPGWAPKPIVLLPAGRIAAGKLAQAIVHGAQVVQIEGNFDDCLRLARSLAESYPVALVNSVNPVRIEGQKTAAFEIVDDLGDAPDLHVLPVGNGGNISAYWRGYVQYAEAGIATRRPRMWAFQAAGAAPLVLGHPVAEPGDRGDGHQDRRSRPRPRSRWPRRRSPAVGSRAVSDDEILAAQGFLAAREGVFVEPASAAGVAGLRVWPRDGARSTAVSRS